MIFLQRAPRGVGNPRQMGPKTAPTAHHWARELIALGHQVRPVPPSYVKAYVKRGKSDAADAEAICETVMRPNMRFVPVKSVEQQGVLVLHRGRELLVRQRTMLVNGLHGHMAEFGIIAPQGIQRVPELVAMLKDETTGIPPMARDALAALVVQISNLTTSIKQMEKRIVAWCRSNSAARRLAAIPRRWPGHCLGIGCHGHGPNAVPIRPAPRGMARPDAAPAFDRRQGQTRPDHENGRPISTQAAGRRHDRGDPIGAAHQGSGLRLGQRAAGAPSRAPGLGRPRQQGGADRLGDPRARRDLPAASVGGRGMTRRDHPRLPTASRSLATALSRGALARGLLRQAIRTLL